MTALTLRTVRASYVPSTPVIQDLSLSVTSGERFVLVGPSGCGKTSILRVIAGLLTPEAGDVAFDGTSVLETPPEKRGVAMVFQDAALLPFRTVGDNIGVGLKLRKVSKAERAARVAEVLDAVQLPGFGDRWPAELSGGQRQRVALARALVVQPRILLLDEPLSSLDPNLRDELSSMICKLQRSLGITMVMVTHDRAEADSIADQVGVMIDGTLRQVGALDAIRRDPADGDVARFLAVDRTQERSSEQRSKA